MEKFNTEGIVVNAIPFKNYDCILTLFTPLEGIIKLFVRGAYSSKRGGGSGITTPLSVVEVAYAKGRGDLYSCEEIAVINHHLPLRRNLGTLEAACEMLQVISTTQQPGKAAPELYQLLMMYLNKLPQVIFPLAISSSFKLKLLRYEGMLAFLSHCSVCAELLSDAWIHENEAYCYSHMPPAALSLTKGEREAVEVLSFCRDFGLLANMNISGLLVKKIGHLFEESLKI